MLAAYHFLQANNQQVGLDFLTQTGFCLSERTVVYSKVVGGKWRRVVLDKNRLRMNSGQLELENDEDYCEDVGTPPAKHQPPNWVESSSGTIVVLEKVQSRRYKSVRTLVKHMRKDIGRIHRYGIEDGLNILMTPVIAGEARIEARDPLLLMPSSYDATHFGPPLEGPKTGEIHLDGFDFRGVDEVIDPTTGRTAQIEIRYVLATLSRFINSWWQGFQRHRLENSMKIGST